MVKIQNLCTADADKMEETYGYAGAKAIIDNFERSGDWEKDHIRLVNKLERYYYDDVGIFNQNIEKDIATMAHLAIAKLYPDNNFIIGDNNVMDEVD